MLFHPPPFAFDLCSIPSIRDPTVDSGRHQQDWGLSRANLQPNAFEMSPSTLPIGLTFLIKTEGCRLWPRVGRHRIGFCWSPQNLMKTRVAFRDNAE
ncbi:hypothetical protein CEXT_381631 [Caerostris extrusa]|uniref:Uncharacterized protein n=1 Tax=Caerostris extrusa TaxID=172846 RepID=A0AAV4WGB1_CAEEX|nr:hypothetical protein CEXT_381631 [Caerostris extrusa]